MILKALKLMIYKRKYSKLRKQFGIPKSTVLGPGFNIHTNGNHERIRIGDSCHLTCNIFLERNDVGSIRILDRVHIGGNTKLISISEVFIGNDVTIAWDCIIYDHDSHPIEWEHRKNDTIQEIADQKKFGDSLIHKDWNYVTSKPIRIEDKVWIGFGVTVLKGVTIGEGSVIGAKSVVTHDIPPYTIAAGNPARIIRNIR